MVVCQLFPAAMRAALGLGMNARRFPPPWSAEETDDSALVLEHGRSGSTEAAPFEKGKIHGGNR
jgi:hypothetical protein